MVLVKMVGVLELVVKLSLIEKFGGLVEFVGEVQRCLKQLRQWVCQMDNRPFLIHCKIRCKIFLKQC